MSLGVLTIHIQLSGCKSLKDKRSRLRPLIHQVGTRFNVSVSEMGLNDKWNEALVAIAFISNNNAKTISVLQKIQNWIENNRFDVTILQDEIEII